MNIDKDYLSRQQDELNKIEAPDSLYPGFSMRFNRIIDMTDLNAPSLNHGRGVWLAKLTESSKSATSDWLKRDKPPKAVMLRKMIYYFCSHLPPVMKNPVFVECWVVYGDLCEQEVLIANNQFSRFIEFCHQASPSVKKFLI